MRRPTRKVEFFAPVLLDHASHNRLEAFRRKDGSVGIRKSDSLKEAEARIEAHVAYHAPAAPLEGPLSAELRMCWPTGGRHAQGEPKPTPPDMDNVEKVVWDVLQRLGFFASDAQIFAKSVCKMWSDPAGVYVRIEELG